MSGNVNVTYHGSSLTQVRVVHSMGFLGSNWAPVFFLVTKSSTLQRTILIKIETLQEKLTAQPPYLNFITHCKKAHGMHHAMTFIRKHSSHKHKPNIHIYNHIYMEIPNFKIKPSRMRNCIHKIREQTLWRVGSYPFGQPLATHRISCSLILIIPLKSLSAKTI